LISIFFFQLIFDNYTAVPRASDALPASSFAKRTPADNLNEDSSSTEPDQTLNELRQQLQAMKKQVLIVMEQSLKSSKKEKQALHQAQEALTLKEAAVAEAAQAATRENFMLEMMTDASQDMAGTLLVFTVSPIYLILVSYPCVLVEQALFWILSPKINVWRRDPLIL
jgi:hypothetical protein